MTGPENEKTAQAAPEEGRFSRALREIASGSALMSFLAIVMALIIGGILIAVTDDRVIEASRYFFGRPGDMLAAVWESVSGAYIALFQGAVYDFRRDDFGSAIRSLTQTFVFATPLIAAGLGVALAFRVGLFNIGGRGQILIGAGFAGYASFAWDLPPVLHVIVALLMGILGGALWGGIAGFLKARTGAHEVIVTIMLNYIAYYLISWALSTQGLLQAPGTTNPKSPAADADAVLPSLFGPPYAVHWGLILVIAATVLAWWLIERSSLGFQFRAVGLNPHAARNAGMKVERIYLYAMLIAGGYAGLAASTEVLGTTTSGFTDGVDAGIGFDAITVALLGRSRPWGVFAAGLLFGAFKTGGFTMQASQGISTDIVLVVQSMIVLFIAAPPLVRAIFRLPAPTRKAVAA